MEIHIARDGQPLGSFPLAEVQRRFQAGEIRLTDLAWHDGLTDWVPLKSISGFESVRSPLPPPVPSPATPPPLGQPATRPINPPRPWTGMTAPTSSLAVASLVLGIVSVSVLPFVASIPAVVCGHMARAEIKRSEGKLSGDGMAVAGLITGYFSLVGLTLLIALMLMGFVFSMSALSLLGNEFGKADESISLRHGRQIAIACQAYAADHDGFFPDELNELIPKYVPERTVFQCPLTHGSGLPEFGYNAGRSTDADDAVLLYSLRTDEKGRRVVVRVDGTARMERFPLPLPAPRPL